MPHLNDVVLLQQRCRERLAVAVKAGHVSEELAECVAEALHAGREVAREGDLLDLLGMAMLHDELRRLMAQAGLDAAVNGRAADEEPATLCAT